MAATDTTLTDGRVARTPAPEQRPAPEPSYDTYGEPRGEGWVLFAGIVLMIAGTVNLIYGIAAIGNAHFYVANTNYVIGTLNTWGWFLTFIGALQFCVALGIWMRQGWARWTGVAFAGANAIIQLLFLPANTWLALAIFTLDLFVVYGLVAYGGRLQEA